jgi:hypothetical protein
VGSGSPFPDGRTGPDYQIRGRELEREHEKNILERPNMDAE